MGHESNGNGRDDGRDTAGRFALGNRGGPGRPRREVEAEYRDVTLGAVTQDDWQRIVERARDDALSGDRHAREWLATMLGLKPPARVAATDGDGGPLTFAALLLASQSDEADEPRDDRDGTNGDGRHADRCPGDRLDKS